jgi:hypothetical protein
MEITICDVCKKNPEEDINTVLPAELYRFGYKEKWYKTKKKKIVLCGYCVDKMFGKYNEAK